MRVCFARFESIGRYPGKRKDVRGNSNQESDVTLRRFVPIAMALAVSWSCGSSPSNSPTSPSTATVSAVAVSGTSSLSTIGQTIQLTATATFSDGTTQNVTATATWLSSNTSVASVTSGGLVGALASGTVTVTATYQGKAGTATIPVSISSSSQSMMTAIIDGTPFNAISVTAAESSGILAVGGTSAFTSPYLVLTIAVPAAVGTYQLGPLTVPNAALSQNSTTSVLKWVTVLGSGGSGTVTLSTVTSTSATGTFSLILVPGPGVGGTPTGTKVITNGVFSVKF
jgi:trimeric autotransporter adhesin